MIFFYSLKTAGISCKKPKLILLPVILVGILGVACSANGSETEVVDESVSASVEKITATLIATATLTITPSPLPTQAPTSTIVPEVTMTPSLEQFLASENFLFEQSNDFGCELPCWESLRIGQTTREEAVSLYKQVLG